MGYLPSLGSKAAHLVSDITTVLLNPISDEPSKPRVKDLETRSIEKEDSQEDSEVPDGPDTSSFTAFLISLLSSSNPSNHPMEDLNEHHAEAGERTSNSAPNENSGRMSLLARGKRTFGKAIHKAAKISGFRQNSEPKIDHSIINEPELTGCDSRSVTVTKDSATHFDLPNIHSHLLMQHMETWDIFINSLQKKCTLSWLHSLGMTSS
ncbi:hypothetical protein GW17_00005684 [Ensete ventricosum]|nr:hypothetical protein GW17_00005684 [Ensete ventricosum]